MKHRDVGTIEVVLDTDESVISRDAVGCGKNELCPRIATPEFSDVCAQGSDVDICVKNPSAPSLKKPFQFRSW
jgi:hypothetical protein